MLDDLRGEASERGMAFAEPAVLIRHLDALVSQCMTLAIEGQAALGSVVGAVLRGDVRIEHDGDTATQILVHKRDDAFGHADHIGRHAHAAIAMRVKRVLQVLCHG